MSAAIEIALVQRIVGEQLGTAPLRLHHNEYGHRSRTFTAELAEQTVMVRTNADPRVFATTADNIDVLRELGIPVPEVLAVDLSCSRYPFAYMLMKAIAGVDLGLALPTMSQQQQRRVAWQVTEFERRVSSLPEGTGYGYAGIGAPAPHPKWREAIGTGTISREHSLTDVDGALLDRVQRALDSLGAYLDRVRSTCFLDDLTTKNVIVEDGVLRGVVDLDVVCYGDPLLQVGLTQTAVGFDLPQECMSYVEHLCAAANLDADQRRIVDLYAALCGVDFLSRMSPGPDHDAGVRRVEGWLEHVM